MERQTDPYKQLRAYYEIDSLVDLLPSDSLRINWFLIATEKLTVLQSKPTTWREFTNLYHEAMEIGDTVTALRVLVKDGNLRTKKKLKVDALTKFYQAEKLSKGRPKWSTHVAIKIGEVHAFNYDYETAERYLRKAEKQALELEDIRQQFGVAMVRGIGLCLKRDWANAESQMLKAVDLAEELGDPELKKVIYSNAALMYMDLGKGHIARLYLQKQEELIGEDSGPIERLSLYRSMVGTYANLGMTSKVLKHGHKYLKLAKQMDVLDHESQAHEWLAGAYKSNQQKDSAFYHLSQYVAVSDKQTARTQASELSAMQLSHERNEQLFEEEVAAKKQELLDQQKLDRQRLIVRLSVGGVVLLIPTLLLLVWTFRRRKKSNTFLEESVMLQSEQKQLLESKNLEIEESVAYAARIQSALLERASSPPDDFKTASIDSKTHGAVNKMLFWFSDERTHPMFIASKIDTEEVPAALLNILMYSTFRTMNAHALEALSASEVMNTTFEALSELISSHKLTGSLAIVYAGENHVLVRSLGWQTEVDGTSVAENEEVEMNTSVLITGKEEDRDELKFEWGRA